MKKVTLGCLGKIFTNRINNQTKIDFRKRDLKKFGLKPEDIMELDITDEIKRIKSKKINNFENDFDKKWQR